MPSPSSLRIALISEHASPLALEEDDGAASGGRHVYVAHVARALAALGHTVDVLTRRSRPGQRGAVALGRGARVLHLDAGPAAPIAAQDLLPHMGEFTEAARRHFARQPAYDAVHAHYFMSGAVGLALRQRYGAPLVTTFHSLGLVRREHQREADLFPPERIAIERTLVQQSDRLIALCPQDESDLLRLYGAAPDRISSVPYGVDTQALRPGDRSAARQRLGLPPDDFIVLQLGRLVPRKGVDTAVQALARLRADAAAGAPAARLIVVGGETAAPDETATPEIARLRQLAHELGVAEHVQFAGRSARADLREWYVAADAFVTVPWYEPFGSTPLEAMACGTPVIGSAVGGVQYAVADGVTGFIVPPRDPDAVAARLLELRHNPALAAALGRAGVRRMRTQFTWEQVAQRLQRVYERVRRSPAALLPGADRLRPGAAPRAAGA